MKYQVALITGASAGIGSAIARVLARQELKLILLARRRDRLEALQTELEAYTQCHAIAADMADLHQLETAIRHLPAPFADIDVLVNCAGLALGLGTAQEADWNDWQTMVNVNCTGLAFLTHQLLPGMVRRDSGHIVNIGSIAGTYPYRGGNVYGATKAFVEQFSLNLKADLLGTAVRVTNIEPGMVGDSEFSLVRFKGDAGKAADVYAGIDALKPEDIAENVLWVLSQPPHVNINRMEIMPVAQAPSRTAYHRKDGTE